MAEITAEPWLRGPMEGVHPLIAPVFFTFMQVREDLSQHTKGLSSAEVWQHVNGTASIGFHVKHIAGSVDRLTTYAMGGQLDEKQMQFLRQEGEAGAEMPELLQLLDSALRHSEERLRQIDPAALYEWRAVGRKALPTTVLGLIVHVAEHTQRHLGQAMTTIKMLKNAS